MEVLFEILAEIGAELYIGLAAELLPEHKFKKWQTVLLKIVYTLISIGSLVLVIGGIVLLAQGTDEHFTKGIAMLVVGAAIIVIHIVVFIITAVKEQKRLKNTQPKENSEDDG